MFIDVRGKTLSFFLSLTKIYEVLHSKVNLFSFFTVNPTYRPGSSNIYEHATKKLTDVLTTSAEETIRGKLSVTFQSTVMTK